MNQQANMVKTVAAAKRSVRITDTTFRDAHQSLWATRMRTDDILAIAEEADAVGYYSLECWGGATFDVCLRYLRENPWDRLRLIKSVVKKTPLQMLLRGQNGLGYKHYPDDILDRLIAIACENGMDIFRIFDALNDSRNLEKAIKAVKKYGGHAQGTICYTYSPVHTVEKFVTLAKEQASMGVDTICIKDMAGILTPAAATALISALIKNVELPIQVHSHMTSGMAVATYMAAVRAGAVAIDTCVSTMSGFSSQPATETMIAMLKAEGYDTNISHKSLAKTNAYFMILKKHREPAAGLGELVDADVLAGKRYEMVTQETRNYVKGLYGRSPAPLDAKIAKKILKGEKPITCRPADLFKPGLAIAAKELDSKLIQKAEDIISFCMFPEGALGYFKWRIKPADQREPIPADLEYLKAATPVSPAVEGAEVKMADEDLKYAEIGKLTAELARCLHCIRPILPR